MAGSTIDHLIAMTVFIGALLIFLNLFNQTIQTAVLYQRHRSTATKCSDLLDNMLLNPGIPANWSLVGNVTLEGFGLQDPEFNEYRLSPFSLMRLLSYAGDKVYYNRTGKWYSNVSWGFGGGYFLLGESDCVNYSTVSKLLGIDGKYGFRLTITPVVNVTIVEDKRVSSHLRLNITVMGQNSPLGDANVEYMMFWADSASGNFVMNTTKTDAVGFVSLDFDGEGGLPEIDVSQNRTAYTFIARVSSGGLSGVGYLSREVVTKAGNIIPFIEDYENGVILLAHKWGKNDPGDECQGALHFNAKYYVLPDNFSPIETGLLNATGQLLVNYGAGKPYHIVRIPPEYCDEVGFLVVTYWRAQEYGMVVMPWGVGTIGLSVVFGEDPSGKTWVATDIRQVLVAGVAYQAKLALWSLEGYEVRG